ncbi:unnamed protein product, partial [Mesorhabditis spiculigera]
MVVAEARWWDYCPSNERFMYCETGCERQCGEEPAKICALPVECDKKNVCECSLGFVRNPDGKCVEPSLCPE